jgi:hypothetical protein
VTGSIRERRPPPAGQAPASSTPAEPARPGPDREPARPKPPEVREIGGPAGPEPTRYGDWEKGGRCTDF